MKIPFEFGLENGIGGVNLTPSPSPIRSQAHYREGSLYSSPSLRRFEENGGFWENFGREKIFVTV
jgi:hypothetical protein